MKEMRIVSPRVSIDLKSGLLKNGDFITSEKRMGDMKGVFKAENEWQLTDPKKIIYTVQAYLPEEDDTQGGLFWGTTTIQPGRLGQEYFMTRGHFHAKTDTAEYYWCIKGNGVLILMDEKRNTWGEEMTPGSLHYINRSVAHRVANTGDKPLVFDACWPSDAGHDYQEIADNGFSARLLDIDGIPTLTK
jgi:glucose-6-phosphate isomerase, archaeal